MISTNLSDSLIADMRTILEGGTVEKKEVVETNKNDKSDDGEGLDAVQPKAVKKKFADRKDKDIDNDGDTDSSDEYMHKKRKAISKSMSKEEVESRVNPENSDVLCAFPPLRPLARAAPPFVI